MSTVLAKTTDTTCLDYLSQRTRDELRFILEKASFEWNEVVIVQENLSSKKREREIVQEQLSKHNTLLIKSLTASMVVVCIICQAGLGVTTAIGALLGGVILAFVVCNGIKKSRLGLLAIREEEVAEALQGLENKLSECRYIFIFPSDYCSQHAVKNMLGFIGRGLANTWQELAIRYEEFCHREKLEESAEKAARNAEIAANLQYLNGLRLDAIAEDVRKTKVATFMAAGSILLRW